MSVRAQPSPAPRSGLLLTVLCLGGGVYAILQSLVVPALPTLQEDLGASQTGVAWLFTVFLVAASVATPIAGRLGDMFGKKRVLLVVLAAIGVGSLVAGLATTLPVMLVGRVIQGLGGAFFPLAFGIIRDELPRERVASGIGLISGLIGIGGGLGIVLAGPILTHLDYHWLYWIPLIAIVPTTVATAVVVPESPVRAKGSVDVVGALLLAAWLVMLLVAISEAPRWGWLSVATLGLVGAAGAVAAVWARVESRTASPLVDMRMMALRGVWAPNLSAFLLGIGMYGSFVLIPRFVQTPESTGYGFGASVTEAGFFILPSALMMIVGGPIAGRLAGRVGSKAPLVIGCIVALASFALLAGEHSTRWEIYLASLLLGLGIGFAFASLANLIVEAVRADQTGVATGMNAVMRTIGGAVGSQMCASVLAATLAADGLPEERGYTISFALMSVAVVGAIFAGLAVPGRRPRRVHVVVAEPQVSVE